MKKSSLQCRLANHFHSTFVRGMRALRRREKILGFLLILGTVTALLRIATPADAAWAEDEHTAAPALDLDSQAAARLNKEWANFFRASTPARPTVRSLELVQTVRTNMLELRRTAAMRSTVPFMNPPEVRSTNGVLTVTLRVNYASNHIGSDPVYLRNYNGRLTGPTLRVHPGDTIRLKLVNDLPTQVARPGVMNTLHAFNTMNLHFHGLEVSPSGNSDNVLLEVGPKETQDYEVHIPADHPAGTFWYHPHLHGSTAGDVGSGLSGAIIIEGGLDEVKEIHDANDRIFLLQQIPYLYNNTIRATNSPTDIAVDIFTNIGASGVLATNVQIVAGVTTTTVTHYGYTVGVVEERDSDICFGPGQWELMDRSTTVNGTKVPLVTAQPGSVERWRFVDAGIREEINLQLVKYDPANPANMPSPVTVPLHRIAADGLPLGKIEANDVLDLWPGYRSDVLVKLPDDPGGDYLLEDAPTLSGLEGVESLKYVAHIHISENAKPMPLPSSSELIQYRLPSIDPNSVTGKQAMRYGILQDGNNNLKFTVNGEPFDMDTAVEVQAGATEEWTIVALNWISGPAGVAHPFHIHVNPFEVFSVVDAKGVEQMTNGPEWRDTWIMRPGWVTKFRTHYDPRFPGLFVQHCHILDHEDQGMMKLVEVLPGAPNHKGQTSLPNRGLPFMIPRPYPAPAWELPDHLAASRSLSDFRNHPVLLVFFEGEKCLRCTAQISELTQNVGEFQKRGIQIVGISSDNVDALRSSLQMTTCPFPLVADPDGEVFKRYGCYAGGPLHGVFLLDASAMVRWQRVSTKPYTELDSILSMADTLGNPAPALNQAARNE
jgi:FtsP/CotA-like multicopper oxidase with cupredoxin domain/peroxiredoxin